MTQFELFCVIFYAIEAVWLKTGGAAFRASGFRDDVNQNEDLRSFLSDADPFIWTDIGSADPAIFLEFCELVPQENIPLEESYNIAAEYINSLSYYYARGVRDAFATITPEEWFCGVKRYMSKPHKGALT